MRLKRLYDHSSGAPIVRGVKVLRAGPVQHFSPRFVFGALSEGWLSRNGDLLIIHGEDGAVIYRIVREPGLYADGQINYFDCERLE